MQKFVRIEGVAAAMPEDNIDTDVIFPARFLLLIDREGLGRHAFHDRRFHPDGSERKEFLLNVAPYHTASILIAGANFGCGSSREQAVWALADFGVRCIIAPSFGDIFFNNCAKNGLLAARLPIAHVALLQARARAAASFAIDLPSQTIATGDDVTISFDVSPDLKAALLNGWNETDLILNAHTEDIEAFEVRQRAAQPWLYSHH